MIHLITVVAHSHYIFKFRLTESLQASFLSTRVINLSPLFPLRAIMIDNDIVCHDIVYLWENECVSVFTPVLCEGQWLNNGGSDLYNIKVEKVYKNDCYEATFAKQAMDTRIIIVNRAKITLAKSQTNYFFLHFPLAFASFFLWKLEEVDELRSSKRLHVRFHHVN